MLRLLSPISAISSSGRRKKIAGGGEITARQRSPRHERTHRYVARALNPRETDGNGVAA
jgi:hypothetical protein